jgi:hypothetical protein
MDRAILTHSTLMILPVKFSSSSYIQTPFYFLRSFFSFQKGSSHVKFNEVANTTAIEHLIWRHSHQLWLLLNLIYIEAKCFFFAISNNKQEFNNFSGMLLLYQKHIYSRKRIKYILYVETYSQTKLSSKKYVILLLLL